MTFSQANTSKKSWISSKNHVKNAFSLTTTLPPSLIDDCTCSCLTKLSYNCLQLQLGWVKFSRAERRKHKDSFAKMLTSLHRSVDFSRELCTPRELLHHGRRAGIEKTTQIRVVSGETTFIRHI